MPAVVARRCQHDGDDDADDRGALATPRLEHLARDAHEILNFVLFEVLPLCSLHDPRPET